MIYEPREDSELLRKYVKKYAFGRVLDVGTGSGIQAIEAGKERKVTSVLAVDIDKKAVELVRKKGVKAKVSDLFSKVSGKFDTVIFNPPYLPEDKGIKDKSLYGGRKGYEVLGRFLDFVSDYLTEKGVVLVVFSSLTGKEKVDLIIERNLLEFEELERKHIFFEELFVYKVMKSKILKELEEKGVSKIKYFAHGKRGNIFVGYLPTKKTIPRPPTRHKVVKVAIKVKRKESKAVERLRNEVKWLKVLNKKKIGPKLLFYGKNYLVYGFAEGEFILDWLKGKKKGEVRKVLVSVLRQCFEMDKLGVNKEEMHRPIKHIVINTAGNPGLLNAGSSKTSGISKTAKAVLIDFERCYKTEKPHNVTQFGVFLMRLSLVSKEKMVKLLKIYKKELNKENFESIIALI